MVSRQRLFTPKEYRPCRLQAKNIQRSSPGLVPRTQSKNKILSPRPTIGPLFLFTYLFVTFPDQITSLCIAISFTDKLPSKLYSDPVRVRAVFSLERESCVLAFKLNESLVASEHP